MILELPHPPSVNDYWNHTRSGQTYISEKGRKFRRDVVLIAKAQLANFGTNPAKVLTGGPFPKPLRLRVHIEVYPPDRRARDLDNINKALLDALEKAGVYEDDSQIDKLVIERREVVKHGKVVVHIGAFQILEESA